MAKRNRRFKHGADQIRAALDYDPETGAFVWRRRNRPPAQEARFSGARAGGFDGRYIAIGVDGVKYRAHQLAWVHYYKEWPADLIDHINGDGRDNRISNLRVVTMSVNVSNQHTPVRAASGFRGVEAHQGKWRARRYRRHLGVFDTREQAAAAYQAAQPLAERC